MQMELCHRTSNHLTCHTPVTEQAITIVFIILVITTIGQQATLAHTWL